MSSETDYFDGLDTAGKPGRNDGRVRQSANMSGTPVELFDLLQGLWQRKRTLILCGALACACAIGLLRLYPARYSAEGLMLVENREPQIPELGSAPPPSTAPNQHDHTVVDVLRSRAMVEKVVHSLNPSMAVLSTGLQLPQALTSLFADVQVRLLTVGRHLGLLPPPPKDQGSSDQTEDIVQYLQKHVIVDMAEGSRIVSVRFESTTPTMAAAVVNQVISDYIASDIARNSALVAQANRWLSDRVAQLRQEVDAADQRVQEYRREKNLFRTEAGSLQAVQLGTDQNALSLAQQELSRKEATLATAQSLLRGAGAGIASEEALASPVIQSLRQRETDLLQRLAMANHRIGPANLDKGALEEELRAVRDQIDAEAKTIVGALTREVDIARLRVAYLENTVARSLKLATASAEAETTLAGLERDADVKRQTYNGFVIRSDHMQFDSAAFASARVISPAIAPRRADPSHAVLIGLLAFCGGVLVAAACLIMRRRLDGTVRSIADLVSNTSMPTLGSLPKLTGNVQVAALEDESSLMAETLRAMRVRLLSDKSSEGGTTVLVTSSDIGEGKTTVATALGRRLAADGVKVLLIEADFRRPKLGALLNLSTDTYLEQVLAGRRPIDEAIQVDIDTGLHCLLASGRTPGPLPLIAYDSFDALITNARKSYQLIILDSPPVLRVADAILLARWSDVTLFVVRCGMTVTLVREALRRLPEAQRATVLLALNYVTRHQFDQRDYYGGYTARRGSATPLLSFGSRE